MAKFTIKSTSSEGVYYLVNHWNKHRAFWVAADQIQPDMLFSAPRFAWGCLTRLLKIMPEYSTDTFELVEM